jgi:hypothetical protein
MELKLTKVVSSLTLLAAWAYSLGWIKTVYYYSMFGVGTESLDLSVQDYLFASWYTVENVLFFILLMWIASIVGRLWVFVVVLLYLPIPYFTDLCYAHLDSPLFGWFTQWFVASPHGILKFVPFIVLFIALVDPDTRQKFKAVSWKYGSFPTAVLILIVVAWSISAAKHIGTTDAKKGLRDPAKYYLEVRSPILEKIGLGTTEPASPAFLFYYSKTRCVIFRLRNGFDKNGSIEIFYLPPEKIDGLSGRFSLNFDAGSLL